MKIAIDPGHGMSNASSGVFDPGATKKVNGVTFAEADIVLRYALTLKDELQSRNIPFFLTRTSSADPAPVGGRATRAANAGCTHYVSFHLNSSASSNSSGLEVLFRDDQKDRPLATRMQAELIRVTGLRNRGIKQRLDLAVLKFRLGPVVLIELGFITNETDRSHLLIRENRLAICRTVADLLT